MKWKKDVLVKGSCKAGYALIRDGTETKVNLQYSYLVEAIQAGKDTDENLLLLIVDREKIDENAAGFMLAGFIIEYGNYLEQDQEKVFIKY